MNFFFDRNMPVRLARMLDVYETEHRIRHHNDDERFTETTPDVEWIRALAADDPPWIVISGDHKILKRRIEREALREANLNFFVMARPWTHMKVHEKAWKFLRIWPEIVDSVKLSAPRIFEVAGGKATKVTALGLTKA